MPHDEDLEERIEELTERVEELEDRLDEGEDELTEKDFQCPKCGLTARSFRSPEAAASALAAHMQKHGTS